MICSFFCRENYDTVVGVVFHHGEKFDDSQQLGQQLHSSFFFNHIGNVILFTQISNPIQLILIPIQLIPTQFHRHISKHVRPRFPF